MRLDTNRLPHRVLLALAAGLLLAAVPLTCATRRAVESRRMDVASWRPTVRAALTTPRPYGWASDNDLVAHGMGSVGGLGRSNTREAFERSYERGYRVFEVDLIYTRDRKLVARHDWDPGTFAEFRQPVPRRSVPTLRQFRRTPLRTPAGRRLTPLTARDVIALMRRHPDAHVMTDLKVSSRARARALATLVRLIGDDPALRDRLIVQIYSEGDLAAVRRLGIRNVVYTFYRLRTSESRALRFAKRNGIRVITMPERMATRRLVGRIHRAGAKAAVHTVNRRREARRLRRMGVDIIYSDGLQP